MFLREASWKYSAKLVETIGPTFLRKPSRKYSSNYDEGIYGVQKASLNMFWEHSGYSTIIFSGWLRAKGSPVAEEEGKKKKKKRGGGEGGRNGRGRYFRRFG